MEGIYYVSPTILSFVAQAGNTIKYRMHNGVSWGSWTTYTEPLTFNYNGTFTVQYKAVNAGGIESEVEEVRIRMNMPYNEDNQYVIRDGQFVYYYNTQTPVELPTTYTEKDEEIRAVWVATVSNIDIGLHTSQADYKAKIVSILNRLSALNFNTIFFQTRPMNDSFYPSEFAPFSRYLTGTEGVDPGWDVFEYLITEAHKRGI